jgi:precorrin-3B synthase
VSFDAPPASEPPRAADVLGVQGSGAGFFVGAALLFGQMRGEQLERLAQCAEARGAVELRLTTRRALLAVGLEKSSAQALCAELADAGFLVDGDDSRLALAACSGKPACASAFADVRAVALSLAPHLVPLEGTLHVSGCAKGCAFNAPARFTFVATRDGYDLVENGRARDTPSFRGLTAEALAGHLTRGNAGARP